MIIEFYGDDCPHCDRMKPLLARLAAEEAVTIESYEIWNNPKNEEKFTLYDKGRCGGVPFFINPQTDAFVCGEDTYEALKEIALGTKNQTTP